MKKGKIIMKDVAIGEKLFIRYKGAIRQVRYDGFVTGDARNFCSEVGMVVRNILYLGKEEGDKVFKLSCNLYRTIKDATDKKAIGDVEVSAEDFAKAYLKGKDWFLNGGIVCGYVWNGYEPVIKTWNMYYVNGIKYLNGEISFVNTRKNYYCDITVDYKPKYDDTEPLEGFYQTAEECKAHNAPTIVMLDD